MTEALLVSEVLRQKSTPGRITDTIRETIRRISLWLGMTRSGGSVMNAKWRILVVDDDRDVLDLIRLKLTNEYDVLCIDEAVDVSKATDLFQPDLIILDIMMPKISGYQVIEYLKRNPTTAQIPICFLSAKASARDLKHGYKLGASLYLTKPFQPERLIRNVKLLFERTPPVRRPKTHTIEEINAKLEADESPYSVARDEKEVQREIAQRDKGEPAPKPEKTPPPEPEEEEPTTRARWLD